MSDMHPTVREVLQGDAPFSDKAYHDDNTGMYVMPEPEPVDVPDMVIDKQSGLFLPKPKDKTVTRIMFDTNQMIDVSEPFEEVDAAIKGHKAGTDLLFSGPVFPDEPVVIKSQYVKRIVCVTVDYRNLSEIELALKQKEYNMRMAESQMEGPMGVPIIRDRNHSHRRH